MPLSQRDFQVTVTAYSSEDDSVQLGYYEGTVSVTASTGTLSGETSEVAITGGEVTLTLQNDTAAEDVTLTVTDEDARTVRWRAEGARSEAKTPELDRNLVQRAGFSVLGSS